MKKRKCLERYVKRTEPAVSPIIGVMLMLVVTIVIAAVVAAFASGIGVNQEKAPNATLDVNLYRGSSMVAEVANLAGDDLETKDLLITVSYEVPMYFNGNALSNGGKTITHIIDGGLEPVPANDLNVQAEGYPYTIQTTNNDAVVSKRIEGKQTFGTAVLASGSKISFDLSYFVGFPIDQTKTYGIFGSSLFHVTIVHQPSSTVLYDKDVKVNA